MERVWRLVNGGESKVGGLNVDSISSPSDSRKKAMPFASFHTAA